MSEETLVGAVVVAIPAIFVFWLFLRWAKAIFIFVVVCLLVALGYLGTTDALAEVGRWALSVIGQRGPAG